jgi:hypothetical protein
MKDQYNPEDDFLKKIIGLAEDEKAPAGFTQKVMAALPAGETVAEKPVEWKPLLIYFLSGLAIVAAFLWFMSQLNFTSLQLLQITGASQYLNYFTGAISIFREGFAGFQFSSLSLTIALSVFLLLLVDRLIKKMSHRNFNLIG